MLCLIPMSLISFYLFDLVGVVTGGLISNFNELTLSLPDDLKIVGILLGGLGGILIILLFPVHWIIMYRGDDPVMMIAIVLPWILCCVVTSGIFAHSPRGGLHTSIAIGLGWLIVGVVASFALTTLLANALGPLSGVIDAAITGLTDLPLQAAIVLSCLEGMAIGSVFGAFIGSLKYKPEGMSSSKKTKSKKKKSKKSKSATPTAEPTMSSTPSTSYQAPSSSGASSAYCTNCGMKLQAGDTFCTNCGAAIK